MNTWEGKDGQPCTGLSVSAWRVEILGSIGKSRPAKVGGERIAEGDLPRIARIAR